MSRAPAYNVVRGVMVLEEPGSRKTSNDWRNRIAGVSARLVKPTCAKCGGTDFAHGLVNGVLCVNWKRGLGVVSERMRFEQRVADIVGKRPENIGALAEMLKEALNG